MIFSSVGEGGGVQGTSEATISLVLFSQDLALCWCSLEQTKFACPRKKFAFDNCSFALQEVVLGTDWAAASPHDEQPGRQRNARSRAQQPAKSAGPRRRPQDSQV